MVDTRDESFFFNNSVPSVTAAVNISASLVVIVVIVVISLNNFISSAKKLLKFVPYDDKYEINSGEYVDSSSIYE